MKTQFSERLSLLMKERKISGKKIGELVGKSQKTISRYANGEVEPTEEMKNAIFKAISTLSGIEDNWNNINQSNILDGYDFGLGWFDPDGAEVEMARTHSRKQLNNIAFLEKEFARMTTQAQIYYLKCFDHFMKIRDWEICVLDFIHSLDTKKQEKLLNYLEKFTIHYNGILSPEKLASYMYMISASQNRPSIIYNRESENTNSPSDEEIDFSEKLSALFSNSSPYDTEDYIADGSSLEDEYIIPTCEYLEYSPFDWYLLLRIQIFESYEDEFNTTIWGYEYPVLLSPKLLGLLNSYI
jgi:transcriptional regulator with XRE-family HTH domain